MRGGREGVRESNRRGWTNQNILKTPLNIDLGINNKR
jgi:hypothetical protein